MPKLILINNFVTHAKKRIGHLSIKKMVEDKDYQIKQLLLATFTNDVALVDLAVQCCDSLEIDPRWLKLTHSFQQAYPVNAETHKLLSNSIVFLVQTLMHMPHNTKSYRSAVNALLDLNFERDQAFCTQLGRDFYVNVFKPLLDAPVVMAASLPRAILIEDSTLLTAWARVDAEDFSELELMAINAYNQLLAQKLDKKPQMMLREKLAKVLMVELRKATQKSGSVYRQTAETIKQGIENPVLVDQFLTVIREFYPYWKMI